MPDVSTQQEYDLYLTRLAEQTHPEILADNVEVLRAEGEKYERSIEATEQLRQFQQHGSNVRLGRIAITTITTEVLALGAESISNSSHEPAPILLAAIGVGIVLGAAAIERLKLVGINREDRRNKQQHEKISLLTQKAESRL